MKLLFVGTNRGGGGTESHFITLARTMQSQGHSVAAVVYPGAPIHRGLIGSDVKLYMGIFRNALDPRGIVAVWLACLRFRPDWIVGSFSKEYWPLAILARILGVKLALFKHMDFAMRPATNYFIPRMANRFIVISHFMAKRFIARGIPSDLIRILHNPLDLELYKPDAELRKVTRQSLGYKDDDIVLGFIGALHQDKGILMLVDASNQAMQRIPKLNVLWLGEGPSADALASRISSGGYASRHSSHKWTADVRPYISALDMLAIPSVESETFGRVSIEAQASGVPVLCSDIGGIPETLLPGVTGLLLPIGNVQAWSDAITMLSDDSQLRSDMAKQGRCWVMQKFSAPVIGRQFVKLLSR